MSGMHWEYEKITISLPVFIVGEAGAVIECTSTPGTVLPLVVDPALHILDTSDVAIMGLEMRPIEGTEGGCAILIEDAHKVLIKGNVIRGCQFGVMVQGGMHAEILRNSISSSTKWQSGEHPYALGISVINGSHAKIARNVVSNAQAGLFASDLKGHAYRNVFSGSGIGTVFCNFPENILNISGDLQGSLKPATKWKFHHNVVRDSTLHGVQFIHGATMNMVANNQFFNNAVLDVELTDSSHRNWVIAGRHGGFSLKDCGAGNKVIGDVVIVDC